MSSNTRQQLESWLKTLEIKGSVLDVGGLRCPVKGRTKYWEVNDYKILDIQRKYKGYKSDYVYDLNTPIFYLPQFDNVFLLEVMAHIYNPVVVLENVARFCKPKANLFLSVHFLFPHHTRDYDCLRYTKNGISRLLEETGFTIELITSKFAAKKEDLNSFLMGECKKNLTNCEIGYLIKAKRNG